MQRIELPPNFSPPPPIELITDVIPPRSFPRNLAIGTAVAAALALGEVLRQLWNLF